MTRLSGRRSSRRSEQQEQLRIHREVIDQVRFRLIVRMTFIVIVWFYLVDCGGDMEQVRFFNAFYWDDDIGQILTVVLIIILKYYQFHPHCHHAWR